MQLYTEVRFAEMYGTLYLYLEIAKHHYVINIDANFWNYEMFHYFIICYIKAWNQEASKKAITSIYGINIYVLYYIL